MSPKLLKLIVICAVLLPLTLVAWTVGGAMIYWMVKEPALCGDIETGFQVAFVMLAPIAYGYILMKDKEVQELVEKILK